MKVTCLKTCNITSNRKRLQKSFCLQSYVSFQSFYLYLHFWAIMHREIFLVCYYTRALQNTALNSACWPWISANDQKTGTYSKSKFYAPWTSQNMSWNVSSSTGFFFIFCTNIWHVWLFLKVWVPIPSLMSTYYYVEWRLSTNTLRQKYGKASEIKGEVH